MIDMKEQREAVAKTAKNVVDSTVAAGTKAVEASSDAADTAADKFREVLARSKSFAETGITRLTAVKVGEKNVGEHAHATVDTVQSAVDVDQITVQVAKLREQMEGVLGTWKETFRPSTGATRTQAAKPTTTKPATKKAAVKLSDLTVPELRSMASDADITGRSTMTKAQLIAALKKSEKASTSK